MTSKTLRIHIGAHKTATTYIQSVLEANQGRMAQKGSVYWNLEQIRPPLAFGLRSLNPSLARRVKSVLTGGGFSPRNAHLRRIDDLLQIDRNVLLSEENILGDSRDVLSGGLYPMAASRFEALSEGFGDRPVEIWLSVRSYAPFLSSIYAESLRHGHFQTVSEVRNAFKLFEGGWSRLVEVLARVRPDAKFIIWRYEDFHTLEDQILTGLTGLDFAERVIASVSQVRPSASRKAIEAQIREAPELNWKERIQKMAALETQWPHKEDEAPFTLFSAEASQSLDAAYHEDCEELAQKVGVTFLRPA